MEKNRSEYELITKEQLSALDAEVIELPIFIIDNSTPDDVIRDTMDRLGEVQILGFDTETKPSFQKGVNHKVALLQLSSQFEVVLIRLNTFEDPTRLSPVDDLLSNEEILKVGVAIHDDAVGLARDYNLWSNACLDLRTLSKAAGITVLSLSKIYATLFGKRISKGQRLTDWEANALSDNQARYGALDAWAGLRIYMALQKYLTAGMIEQKLEYNAGGAKKKAKKYSRQGKGAKGKSIKKPQGRKTKSIAIKKKQKTAPAQDEK